MKKRILKVAIVVCGIVMFGPLFAHAQIQLQKPLPTAPTPPPPQDLVASIISSVKFTPAKLVVAAGGCIKSMQVIPPVRWSNLTLQIIKDGRLVSTVSAKPGVNYLTDGAIIFQAYVNATVAAGYQLKFSGTLVNQQKVEAVIPTNVFSIEVVPNTASLTRITPSVGAAGSVVVVEGTGFLTKPNVGVAFMGGNNTINQDAKIISATNTVINLIVPPYAISGKIELHLGCPSAYDWATVTSGFIFEVRNPPLVVSFYPTGGYPGSKVDIRGYNIEQVQFSNGVPANILSFSAVTAIVNGVTQPVVTDFGVLYSHITVVPQGAVTGPLKVLSSGGTSTSAQNFIVQTGSSLTAAPVITQFTPGNGNTGTVVTISGQNFGQDAIGVGVQFGTSGSASASMNPSSCNNEVIKVTVPTAGTTGTIYVKTSGGSAASTGTFYYPPSIHRLSSTTGPVGYVISIIGRNFDISDKSANVVKINGIQANVVRASLSQDTVGGSSVDVTVPTGASSGFITVETPGGKATSPQSFTVVQ